MSGNFKLASQQIERWRTTMQETLSDRRVRRFLLEDLRISKLNLDEIVRLVNEEMIHSLDEGMRRYAFNWSEVSARHKARDLYKKIADFAGLDDHELVVDLCCGPGSFLSQLGRKRVLGVDINPYMLELAAETFRAAGVEAGLYLDSHISFDPDRGFVLKPTPILAELDLDGVNLIADDVETLHNLMRVLYNQGKKADVITFMLFGGFSQVKYVEFLDLIKRDTGDSNSGNNFQPFHQEDLLIRNAHRICKKGGRLILGFRGGASELEGSDYEYLADKLDQLTRKDLEGKYRDFIEVRKFESIELTREDAGSGISIYAVPANGADLSADELAFLQTLSYSLILVEAIVKND